MVPTVMENMKSTSCFPVKKQEKLEENSKTILSDGDNNVEENGNISSGKALKKSELSHY